MAAGFAAVMFHPVGVDNPGLLRQTSTSALREGPPAAKGGSGAARSLERMKPHTPAFTSRLAEVDLGQLLAQPGPSRLEIVQALREGVLERLHHLLSQTAGGAAIRLEERPQDALALLPAEELRLLCRDCQQAVAPPGDAAAVRAAAADLLAEAVAQRDAARRLRALRMGALDPDVVSEHLPIRSSGFDDGPAAAAAAASAGDAAAGAQGSAAVGEMAAGTAAAREAGERLLEELFDQELRQRVLSASAAAASSTSADTAAGAPAERQPAGPAGHAPPLARSSMPAHLRAAAADPWAPLPSPEQQRAALPARAAALLRRTHAAAAERPGEAASLTLLRRSELVSLLEDGGHSLVGRQELSKRQMVELLSRLMAGSSGEAAAAGDAAPAVLPANATASHSSDGSTQHTHHAAGTSAPARQQAPPDQAQPAVAAAAGQPVPSGGYGMHPLRDSVMAAASARQLVMEQLVDPREIGEWLLAAKMRDVAILDTRGQAGLARFLVLATGASHAHVTTAVEAVRWRLKMKLQDTSSGGGGGGSGAAAPAQPHAQPHAQRGAPTAETPAGSSATAAVAAAAAAAQLLPGLDVGVPKVVDPGGSDWMALDAGRVVVHAFTERARTYYDIESLWGAGTREAPSVEYLEGRDGEEGEGYLTLDTIRLTG